MFGFDFSARSGAPRARGLLVSSRLGLLVDGGRRRRRDLRRVQRSYAPSSTTAARCCGRARGGAHGGHTSAACTRSLGTTSPAPVGPAARTFSRTSHGARRQFRGWCNNRAARRQAGARQPRSGRERAAGAHVREQEEGLLAGREGAAGGSEHDCAWRRNQTFLAIIAARCESSAATSSSELSELARSRCSIGERSE